MSSNVGGLIGTVVQMIGSGRAAIATHDLALENAGYYLNNAINELVRTEDRKELKRQEIRTAIGQQKTGYAKGNVAISGSAILALAETARRGESDLIAIDRQGLQAYTDQIKNMDNQIDIAKNARRNWAFDSAQQAVATGTKIYGQVTQDNNEQVTTDEGLTYESQEDANYFASQDELLK